MFWKMCWSKTLALVIFFWAGVYKPPMGRSNKLLPRHKGPYQVIGRKQLVYKIGDLAWGKQIKIHNLWSFIFNPHQVSPLEVTQKDEQKFKVEKLHRDDHHRRSTTKFLDRWPDHDESSNSWEEYKALMIVDKPHDYLGEHKMQTLIPTEHKLLRRIFSRFS